MNNRITTLRQESRPPNLRSVVIDHHKPDFVGERWIAAAWGFIAGVAFCGAAIVVFWG